VGLAQWRHERLAGAADSHDLAAEQSDALSSVRARG
jgi:hypothetical protein